MRSYNKILIFSLLLTLFACSGNKPSASKESKKGGESMETVDKQLNINVLLDLSDRLEKDLVPSQKDRDLEIINALAGIFKKEMETKGAFMAKGKIKVHFSPLPNDPDINSIANSLSVDLSQMHAKQKKEVFDNIETNFRESLNQIYSKTLESKNWIGCDVWRFFKNNVEEDCISDPEIYDNYLIVLTDGYIYHKQSVIKDGNKTQYVTPNMLGREGLRGKDWKEKYESGNYGIMKVDRDLSGLKVLVLEVNPSKVSAMDEDVLFQFWKDWLITCNVDVDNDFKMYTTQLSNTTVSRINKFIQ